jgi:acetate kinase
MKILVLNCGSSTLKFQLIETGSVKDEERKLARGIVDRIGKKASYRFEAMGAVWRRPPSFPLTKRPCD